MEFVGRSQELQDLHQFLQQERQVLIAAAIAGMGGIGKTELALQYAIAHRASYQGGICWLRALEDVGLQVVQFARTHLSLNPPNYLDLQAQVAYCWQRWHEGEVLLVLDNVIDYGKIKPYLPSSPRFKVLITTRSQLGTSIKHLSLDVLQPEAALELLQLIIGAKRVKLETLYAKSLCEWLGYLPLGLELVGRYLARKPDLSLAQMLRRLEEKRLHQRALAKNKSDEDMTAQHDSALAAFELSWGELNDTDRQLACLLSLFACAPIPWNLVEKVRSAYSFIPSQVTQTLDFFGQQLFSFFGETNNPLSGIFSYLDPTLVEEARNKLLNLHLLQRKSEEIYQLHPLLREFFQIKLKGLKLPEAMKSAFVETMVAVAKEIPHNLTRESIAKVAPLIPHLAEIKNGELILSIGDEDLIWAFLHNAEFYNFQGLYNQTAPWYEECLKVIKKRLGDSHPHVANILNRLGGVYNSQGRYEEAESLFKQALELYKHLSGESHSNVAMCLFNLALNYRTRGRYKEAEALYLQALEMHKRCLGELHTDVAASLNGLGLIYYEQGCYKQAEPLYLQALKIYKRLLDKEDPDTLNNLANLYNFQGRYEEAEILYLQVLKIYKSLLGEKHPSVANSLNNLGLFYCEQGRYTEAENLCLESLEMKKLLLGEEHPDIAGSLCNLGYLYYHQKRYTEAEPLYLKSLEMHRRLLGETHPHVAVNLNSLALLYHSQGNYEKSESLFQQALEMKRLLLGKEHPDVATTLNDLANLYFFQRLYEQAEPLYQEAFKIRKQCLGENHPQTISVGESLENLRIAMKTIEND